MQLELGGDEGGGELGVGGCAGASAPDLGGDEVKLFAVLVGDDRAGGGTGVGSDLGNDDAVRIDRALGRLRLRELER